MFPSRELTNTPAQAAKPDNIHQFGTQSISPIPKNSARDFWLVSRCSDFRPASRWHSEKLARDEIEKETLRHVIESQPILIKQESWWFDARSHQWVKYFSWRRVPRSPFQSSFVPCMCVVVINSLIKLFAASFIQITHFAPYSPHASRASQRYMYQWG